MGPMGSGVTRHGVFVSSPRRAADAGVRYHRLRRRAAPAGFVHLPTVTDARAVFATPARRRDVVVAWPHHPGCPGGAKVISTVIRAHHDPVPDVRCSGGAAHQVSDMAMGSRKTRRPDGSATRSGPDRRRAETVVQRSGWIACPDPRETAVSIAADIIARRWGGGRPLADIARRIHHDAQVAGEVQGLPLDAVTPFSQAADTRSACKYWSARALNVTSVDPPSVVGSVGRARVVAGRHGCCR